MALVEREITIIGSHGGGGALNGFRSSNQRSAGYDPVENYENDPLGRLDRATSGRTEYYRRLESSNDQNLSDPFDAGPMSSSSVRTLIDSVGAGGEMVMREKSISDGGPSVDSVPRAPEPHTSWRFYTSYDNGEWRRHAVPVYHSEEEVMNTSTPRSGGRLRTESFSGEGSSRLSLSPTFGLETSVRRMRVGRPSVYESLQNRRRRNHEGVRRLCGPRSPEYILNSAEFLDPEERKRRYEIKDYVPTRRTEYGEKVIYPRATPEQSLTGDSSAVSKVVTSFQALGSSLGDPRDFEEVTRTVHSFNDGLNLFRDGGGETVTVVREKEPMNDYGFQEKIIIPTKYRTDKVVPKIPESSKGDNTAIASVQSVNQFRDSPVVKNQEQFGNKRTTIIREKIVEPSAFSDFDSSRFESDRRGTQLLRGLDGGNDLTDRSSRRVEKVVEYDNRGSLLSQRLKETSSNQEREVKVVVVNKSQSEIPSGLLPQTQFNPVVAQPQTQPHSAMDPSYTQFHPAMVQPQPQFYPTMVQPQFHPVTFRPQFQTSMVQQNQFHPAMVPPQFQQPSMAQTEFQSTTPQSQFHPAMAQLQFDQPMPQQGQFYPAMQQAQFHHPSMMAQASFQPVQFQSQPTRPIDAREVMRHEQKRDGSELAASSQKGSSRADELANQVRSGTMSTMKQMENQMLEQLKSKCPEAEEVVNTLMSGVGSDGTTVEKKEAFAERVSLWQAGRPVEDRLNRETRFHTNDPVHGPQDFVEKSSISRGDEETPDTAKTPFLSPFVYPKMEFRAGHGQFSGSYPSYVGEDSSEYSRKVQQMDNQSFHQPRLSSVFLPDDRLMSARQAEGKSRGMPNEYSVEDIRQHRQSGRQEYVGDGRIATTRNDFVYAPEKKVEQTSTERIIIPTKYAKKNVQQSSDGSGGGGSVARLSSQSSQDKVQDVSRFDETQRSFDSRDPRKIEATSNRFASIPSTVYPESSTFEERLDVLDGRFDAAPRGFGSTSVGREDRVASAAHFSRLNSVHGLGASGDWEFDMAVNEIPQL